MDIQRVFDHFTNEDNITELVTIEGYKQHKIIAAYNLHKALQEYGEANHNPQALNIATHINQDILQLAINSIKPHVLMTDIEQSNNIYLLRDNLIKCEEFRKLIIKLRELDIEGILDQGSPFYELSTCVDHLEEAEIATIRRISAISTKNLKLPELPEREE